MVTCIPFHTALYPTPTKGLACMPSPASGNTGQWHTRTFGGDDNQSCTLTSPSGSAVGANCSTFTVTIYGYVRITAAPILHGEGGRKGGVGIATLSYTSEV